MFRLRSRWAPSIASMGMKVGVRCFVQCDRAPDLPNFFGWLSAGFGAGSIRNFPRIGVHVESVVLISVRRYYCPCLDD